MQNVRLLEGLKSDETKTSQGLVISYFGNWWRHMKTGNCIKHKDLGNWKINTDVYVAGLWFLVRFGAECDSYTHTLSCFRVHNVQCNNGG